MQKTDPAGSDNANGAQSSQSLEPQDEEEYEFIDAVEEFGEPPLKLPVQTTEVDEQLSCKGDFHQHDSQPFGEKVNGLFCLFVSIILLRSLCFHILW